MILHSFISFPYIGFVLKLLSQVSPGSQLHLRLCLHVCLCGTSSSTTVLPTTVLTELVVCDVSLRAQLIMAYISTLPRPDYSPAELKSTVQMCLRVCEIKTRQRKGKRNTGRKRERPFFTLGWTLSLHPCDSFLIFLIQMAASAGRHASGAWEWAPSLLLCRSHLLPSLFALLSAALPCRPIHQQADTLRHTCIHVYPPTVST